MKKLELKNVKIKTLSKKEQSKITGGFTSIGVGCSIRNSCKRIGCQGPIA